MSLSRIKNDELDIVVKLIAVIILLITIKIVFFIKIFNLDSFIYIAFMIAINMICVYLFWWKNKENRDKENIK
jgi:hypothetical protein